MNLTLLSVTATTPGEFLITGDFIIHVDSSTEHITLSICSSCPLSTLIFPLITETVLSTFSRLPLIHILLHLCTQPTPLHLTTAPFLQNCPLTPPTSASRNALFLSYVFYRCWILCFWPKIIHSRHRSICQHLFDSLLNLYNITLASSHKSPNVEANSTVCF